MPQKPPRSRELLDVGTVFYHRQFQGHTETKDRYFIVVGSDDTDFFCLTTSTSQRLISNPKFASEITPVIPSGSECFRKDCVVDCKELHLFDDIVLSSYIGSGRVTVEGTVSEQTLQWITSTVSGSQLLSPREKKAILSNLSAEQKDD